MKSFGPLYAKASTGKIKVWQAISTAVCQDSGPDKGFLTIRHGYIDGKITDSEKEIHSKNTGRSNETTPYDQACADAQSKMNKKMDEGYVLDQTNLTDQVLLLPMLAHPYAKRKHNIEWPAYVQPKLNGVRCIASNGEYLTRKGKQWTTLAHLNEDVAKIRQYIDVPLDGEIFHPDWGFQEIIRAVKKDRGDVTKQLQYWVYDIVDPELDFEERNTKLHTASHTVITENIIHIDTFLVQNEEEMMARHKEFTEAGFEGTIIRNLEGKYELKNRSKNLQKYKTMLDQEYTVIGAHEGTGNDIGTAVFECETETGIKFSARPKGSREVRKQYLEDIENIKSKQVTIQYQEKSEQGVPIFPVVLCIRDYE